jgi:hypothetical protein
MKLFLEFHARAKFEKSLNATVIYLILKTVGAVEVKKFLPISLVSGIYKIISKGHANRLKIVLENISKSMRLLSSRKV